MGTRITTISFFDFVAASSNKTLVSQRIGTPFRIKHIQASFAPGVERLMKLYFFVSPDSAQPTTKVPTGTNLLAQTGQARYLTGDDESKGFGLEVYFAERGYYVKVYAENTDTYAHTIDVQITIELEEPEEKKTLINKWLEKLS